MRNVVLPLPLLGFVVGTRAALGVGLGLLLSTRLSDSRRRALGLMLLSIGAAMTIPAALAVFRRRTVGSGGHVWRAMTRPPRNDSEIAENLRQAEGDQEVPGG